MATTAALRLLGYFEMPEDEQPPEEIWHHDELLNDWFEALKDKRKYGTDGPDVAQTVPMTRNTVRRPSA